MVIQTTWFFMAAAMVILCLLVWAAVLVWEQHRTLIRQEYRVAYTVPDFTEAAGFRLEQYPDNEICIPTRYWLINNKVAEVEYDIVAGQSAYLRAAKQGEMLLPESYREEPYESSAEYQLGDVVVLQRQSPGRKALLTWDREEFEYALLLPQPEMNQTSGLAVDFVANTHAVESR